MYMGSSKLKYQRLKEPAIWSGFTTKKLEKYLGKNVKICYANKTVSAQVICLLVMSYTTTAAAESLM